MSLQSQSLHAPVVSLIAGETRRTGDKIKMGKVVLFERRKGSGASYSRTSHRLREIETIIKHRHGFGLPDTDDADTYLLAVAHSYQAQSWVDGSNAETNLKAWCSVWAKHISTEQIAAILETVSTRKHDLNLHNVAELLCVTWAERERLHLRRFGAFDISQEELRSRIKDRKRFMERNRIERKRRSAGVQPREVYLSHSNEHNKPWEAEGVSKRTWYRRKALAQANCNAADTATQSGGTGVLLIDKNTTSNTSVPKVTNADCGTTSNLAPFIPCQNDLHPKSETIPLGDISPSRADAYPSAPNVKVWLRGLMIDAGFNFQQITEATDLADECDWTRQEATQAFIELTRGAV